MLRLYFPNGSLLIGHRAALTPARSLSCLASEDEVRRLLLVALTNPAALEALRRFWANWHSESKRVNVIDDRKLIDRVARMTVNGPLAAFAVYDRHAVHPGDVALKLSAQRQVAATGAPVPAHLAAPGTQASATVDLTEMSAEQRLEQMLRRTPRYLPQALRVPFAKVFERDALVAAVAVMTVWARYRELGIGGILDALLLDSRHIDTGWTIVGAARKLHYCIEATVEAEQEKDIDAAARVMGEVIEEIGVAAFKAAIQHGAERVVSWPMKPKPPPRPAPAAPRQPPARLEQRPQATTPPRPPTGKILSNIQRKGAEAFKRDASGKIKAEKTSKPFISGHGGAPGEKFVLEEYALELNDGSKITAFKSKGRIDPATGKIVPDARMDSDCHGVTFTDGEYWINNDQVDQMLAGGGYMKTTTAKPGDVLVYRDENGEVVHSVTVTEVDKNGKPTKVSGLGGIEMKEHSDPPDKGWYDPNAQQEVWSK
jgi:hypothetical protein